jgi:nucleoside-diphosphate-sugar epimerase
MKVLPKIIESEAQLQEVMTEPPPRLIEMVRGIKGDFAILGIAGKMGVTLGITLLRACGDAGVKKRIVGISRFSDPDSRKQLEDVGLETISCDLLKQEQVASLPKIENVIFMAGKKFGTTSSEDLTWAMNTVAPAYVAEHFCKSRIVAFSTGCVYPIVPVESGGCTENDPPGPVGEYAQSCLGRERVFTYFSKKCGTPATIIRLNYAIDLHYGTLLEIAQAVWNQTPVDLSMGYFNAIWQGDANVQSILSLELASSPPKILNVTGPELLSTREVATHFGKLMDRKPIFEGKEDSTALLNNSAWATKHFGKPRVSVDQMIEWTAHWIKNGNKTWNKPTHFQTRDGKF